MPPCPAVEQCCPVPCQTWRCADAIPGLLRRQHDAYCERLHPSSTAKPVSHLVSVIIPTFNSAPHLPRAIQSVLAQTYPAVDLIVVDDGSMDETQAVLAGFGSRLRHIRQENRGPAAARNHGVALSRGEYVMFLDADDWILPEKLARQVRFLMTSPSAGWVYCDVTYVDERGQHVCLASERFAYARRTRLDGDLFPELLPGNFIPVHALMIRRHCLVEAGPFDEERRLIGVEDWDLLLRLSLRTRAAYLPEVLAGCLLHSGSLSADPAARDRRRFNLLDKAIRTFPDQIRALGRPGRRLVADTHNWFGYRLYQEGRWANALERLRASLRAWPWQGRAWWFLVRCLVVSGGRADLSRPTGDGSRQPPPAGLTGPQGR